MQPIHFSNGTKLVAVVRIETPTQFATLDSPELPRNVADLIAASARKPAVVVLQIVLNSPAVTCALRTPQLRLPAG